MILNTYYICLQKKENLDHTNLDHTNLDHTNLDHTNLDHTNPDLVYKNFYLSYNK